MGGLSFGFRFVCVLYVFCTNFLDAVFVLKYIILVTGQPFTHLTMSFSKQKFLIFMMIKIKELYFNFYQSVLHLPLSRVLFDQF